MRRGWMPGCWASVTAMDVSSAQHTPCLLAMTTMDAVTRDRERLYWETVKFQIKGSFERRNSKYRNRKNIEI
jgi:hypothetical protein